MNKGLITAIVTLGLLLAALPAQALTVPREQVMEAARGLLVQELEQLDGSLTVAKVYYPHALNLPDGERVAWQLDLDDPLKPGRHSLEMTALVDGEARATAVVSVTVARRLMLPVVARDMRRGDLVGAGDISWKEFQFNRPMADLVLDELAIVGQVANRMVRAGQPLKNGWFEAPLAVDRGDLVRVNLKEGGLTIETSALAMSQGRVGDMIQVRNPRSQRLYMARVVAAGQADVVTR